MSCLKRLDSFDIKINCDKLDYSDQISPGLAWLWSDKPQIPAVQENDLACLGNVWAGDKATLAHTHVVCSVTRTHCKHTPHTWTYWVKCINRKS